MNRSDLEANTSSMPPIVGKRVGASDGFGFTSDWFKRWREIFLANHKA